MIERILEGLDNDQRMAATIASNAVVAAGAGSGKTRVLAARYAYLVMAQGYPVESILALTFTNKAANEMYSRIYALLMENRDAPLAREGIENFYKAKIATLDSFCAQIARSASRSYGISPSFNIDDPAVRDLALELSVPFILDRRDNPALKILMAEQRIGVVALELFADTMIRHSPISRPLDMHAFQEAQRTEILSRWKQNAQAAESLARTIEEEMEGISNKKSQTFAALQAALHNPVPPTPEIALLLESGGSEILRREITGYFSWLATLKSVERRGGAEYGVIKECLLSLRDAVYPELEAVANTALHWDIVVALSPLMEEFQGILNRTKREAQILNFTDVSHLAVDALLEHPEIRSAYKREIRAIMIDEFQDNNSLQRDLIYLLAENPDRMEAAMPHAADISPNRMFLVGDEKQSIYRFRGADVSVFRSLAENFSPEPGVAETVPGINLQFRYNYRSRPALVEAFNYLFGGLSREGNASSENAAVFLPESLHEGKYEAAYSRIIPAREASQLDATQDASAVHMYFIDQDRLPETDQGLSSQETEAAFIAFKIRSLVDSGYPIALREQNEESSRPCRYEDFAILQRTYSHQHHLEKQLKDFGIPYSADRPTGLFIDAPVNDLCCFLRLINNPTDRLAYAALIRSPFMRLSDSVLTVCMLSDSETPFDIALQDSIPQDEQDSYALARETYNDIAKAARELTLTQLITRLWYVEGYRYEIIWPGESQNRSEFFDLFFELARAQEAQGSTLSDFLDHITDLINREERFDDMSVPREVSGVRLMSIHRSKGLEFPIVFLFCAASDAMRARNDQAAYFNESFGIAINLPRSSDIPKNSAGNLFFMLEKEEEAKKQRAELRRLLYVAMTRAEHALFVTSLLGRQQAEEKKKNDLSAMEYTDELIRERLLQVSERKRETANSFLDLLLPTLVPLDGSSWSPLIGIHHIPAWTRRELASLRLERRSAREAGNIRLALATEALALYTSAEQFELPSRIPDSIAATDLAQENSELQKHRDWPGIPRDARSIHEYPIEAILKKSGLDALDFGTLVHALLEARLSRRPLRIPAKIHARLDDGDYPQLLSAAIGMTESFFNSPLGRECLAAEHQEAEFPVVSIITVNGRTIAINGQIDLLFYSDAMPDTITIVDFKTDQLMTPAQYLPQLALYTRATGDIFGKPVRAWLYYLRYGVALDVTEALGEVDIEALAEQVALINVALINNEG